MAATMAGRWTLVVLFIAAFLRGVDTAALTKDRTATPFPVVSESAGIWTFPARCAPAEVAALIVNFFDTFNRGRLVEIAGFFPAISAYPYADASGFQWYSVGSAEDHFVAHNRDELLEYLRLRIAQQERLLLTHIHLRTGSATTVHMRFSGRRVAADVPETGFSGYGAVDCKGHTIFVWSMVHDSPPPLTVTSGLGR
jgi:hypothetical protein